MLCFGVNCDDITNVVDFEVISGAESTVSAFRSLICSRSFSVVVMAFT